MREIRDFFRTCPKTLYTTKYAGKNTLPINIVLNFLIPCKIFMQSFLFLNKILVSLSNYNKISSERNFLLFYLSFLLKFFITIDDRISLNFIIFSRFKISSLIMDLPTSRYFHAQVYSLIYLGLSHQLTKTFYF